MGEGMGEIELEGNVLVIRRIHVRLMLKRQKKIMKSQRACTIFAEKCPVHRTLKPAIAITRELVLKKSS